MNIDSTVLQIPIEDIIPGRFQPRSSFDDESLKELAQSIKEHGIIQPLVVRRNGDKYEIIAGERRYRAAQMASLASVPGLLANVTDEQGAELAMTENIQRKSLNSIEEGKSYKLLLEKGLMNQEQLSTKMGITKNAIENKIKLLNLTLEVQKAVTEGRISERHARCLLVVKDPAKQVAWLNRIINDRLNVRQLNALLKEEYGDIQPANVDIDYIKSTAVDIPVSKVEHHTEEIGPVTLGSGTSSMNNLEDEAANMSTEDVESLMFDLSANNEQTALKEAPSNDIEMLDIDTPTTSFGRDASVAEFAIDNVLNNLKDNGWLVEENHSNSNGKLTYSITIEDSK